ncbi:MAG: hypothetical protein LQ343_005800 [Gyalolechia ehrenbergii]|nr:MAG: hypothetical protein LQ343_005800 [Gyalolechia ehrenbergii]
MAHNNQRSGVQLPAGAQSIPQTATNDFQAGQPMNTAHPVPGTNPKQTHKPSSSKVENKLEREGHLPGLPEVQHDDEKNLRQPGEDDAAGNKIHHKGILKKLFHWEHNGMNAD